MMAKKSTQRRNAIYEKAKQGRPAIVSLMSLEIGWHVKQKVLRKSWFVWKCEFIQEVTSWSEQTAGSHVWGSATQRLLFQWAHISIFTRLSTSRLLTRAFFGAVSFQHCTAFNRGEQTMNVFWAISTVRASTRGPMITCWALTHGLTQIQRQSGLHLGGGGESLTHWVSTPCPCQALNRLALLQDVQILRLGEDTDLACCSLQPWLRLLQ